MTLRIILTRQNYFLTIFHEIHPLKKQLKKCPSKKSTSDSRFSTREKSLELHRRPSLAKV